VSLSRTFRTAYVRSGLQGALPHGLKHTVRRIWVHVARKAGYPISSPLVPRPPLRPGRVPMRLSHALLACDLNPDYLDFWPGARRAWREIVGIEPLLVLVAAPDEVPPELGSDEAVVVFQPVAGIHSALQAQCIRLLYPALVETDRAVVITDIDLYPLDPRYFHEPIAKLDRDYFVSYRDILFNRGEVSIVFNAATPGTWGEVFGVEGLDDVRRHLADWGAGKEYDGRRGWEGWHTDQRTLYRALREWPARDERLWTLDDDYCGFNRLDRLELEHEDGLLAHRRRALRAMKYSDYNCLGPYREHRELNKLVLELGLEAARAGAKGRRQALPVG
jgi:hypothetical protein